MSSENPPHRLNPRIHLERAQGFFELEMFNEAEVELRAFLGKYALAQAQTGTFNFPLSGKER